MAKAKTNNGLVEAARAFMSHDGFKQEVISTMPAEVIYSFESAMEQVLVSKEGFNAFKNQWIAVYRKYARRLAKDELGTAWDMALQSSLDFVERENQAGNDGQEIFDNRFREDFVARYEEIKKIRRLGFGFDLAAAREVEELNKLIYKLDNAKVAVAKKRTVKKPGSAAARNKSNTKTKAVGGGKKRGAKCRKQK